MPLLPFAPGLSRTRCRPSMAALVLALVAALPAQAAVTAMPASADRASPGAAQALPHATPWWMAFDDAALNLLVRRALERERGLAELAGPARAGQTGPAQPPDHTVVAAYLGTRVLSTRWLALQGLLTATDRQRQLLEPADSAGPPGSAAARDALLARHTQIVAWQAALAEQRAHLIEVLALHCGHDPRELAEMLAPALSQATVPSFGLGVPTRLPRGILRERPDVARAESALLRSARLDGAQPLRMLQSLQASQGWIEAQAEASGAAQAAASRAEAAAADSPELDDLRALLAQAEEEVARDLRSLSERAQAQATLARQADTTRLAYLAAREQQRTGALSEWQLLEQYQQWLVAAERQATASGELALAWLQLVASTGGSGQVLAR